MLAPAITQTKSPSHCPPPVCPYTVCVTRLACELSTTRRDPLPKLPRRGLEVASEGFVVPLSLIMSSLSSRPTTPRSAMFDDVYQLCVSSLTADQAPATEDVLQCVSQTLSGDRGAREFSRIVLLIYSAALVFIMQAGFAMVCAGAVRKKNVQNTMLKNLLDACGASLAFFTVGYAFAFGGSDYTSATKTFVGAQNFFLVNVDEYAFFLFQYAFSAASATIVAGTLVSPISHLIWKETCVWMDDSVRLLL